MIVLIVLFIAYVLIYKYKVDFDYIKDENLFLIFYSAKNNERKCLKIKL